MKYKHNREVLFTIAKMDLKLKYQNSKIGFLWSFLKPLLQFCAYFTVFQVILHVNDSPDYPLRLFLGVLIWNFFVEATGSGMNAYIGKKSIVTKIKIEKKILPLASYLTAFMNFLLTMIIFLIVYNLFAEDASIMFSWESLVRFIFFLTLYSVFIISINIILATTNVLFRDLQNIWDIVLMYGVFLTPIIYPLSIPESYLGLYYFANPLAYPVEQLKAVFFGAGGSWDHIEYFYCFLAAICLWGIIAWIVNRKMSSKVADYL